MLLLAVELMIDVLALRVGMASGSVGLGPLGLGSLNGTIGLSGLRRARGGAIPVHSPMPCRPEERAPGGTSSAASKARRQPADLETWGLGSGIWDASAGCRPPMPVLKDILPLTLANLACRIDAQVGASSMAFPRGECRRTSLASGAWRLRPSSVGFECGRTECEGIAWSDRVLQRRVVCWLWLRLGCSYSGRARPLQHPAPPRPETRCESHSGRA